MKRTRSIVLLLTITLFTASCGQKQAPTEGKKILIYTRNGSGYVHDNIEASVKALEEICAELGIETEATDTPVIFTPEKLAGFDGIIFSNANNEAFTTDRKLFLPKCLAIAPSFMKICKTPAKKKPKTR